MRLIYQESTQCPTCGYTHSVLDFIYDEVVYYKSGKNKGEVKEINQKRKQFSTGLEFKKVRTGIEGTSLGFVTEDDDEIKRLDMRFCEKCGTTFVKLEKPNQIDFGDNT